MHYHLLPLLALLSLPCSAPAPTVVVVQGDGVERNQSIAPQGRTITPITSLSASCPTQLGGSCTTAGALQTTRASSIDITSWTGSGTATITLVVWDTTAGRWVKYGPDCAVTTAANVCRVVARHGPLYWHVYKSSGTLAQTYIEQVERGPIAMSIESQSSGGLATVSVSSPLSGDGTAGSPIALGSPGGDISGSYASMTVAKIRGYAVSSNAPTGGQVHVWDSGANEFVPTTKAYPPLTATAGQTLQHDGSVWAAVWRPSHVWAFTSTPTLNWYFGAVSANGTAHNVRAFYVRGSGKINFVKLWAINATANGSVTVQVYTSTDGYTWTAVAGQTRTITLTSGTTSATSSGALADISVSDGTMILLRMTGYSGTAASLNALITATEGAQIA